MRKMKSKYGTIINVVEHIILKNGWEYYVTDDKTDHDDIKFCLVMGDETELGDVYMPEIAPYIISRTKVKESTELMPASRWEWV